MRTSLVLTVISDDRPGIVEQLAERVLAVGANWEESRMARLSGKFAGLLRVSVDAARADDLSRSLTALGETGVTVVVTRTAEEPPADLRALQIDLVGNDRPGIIRDISRVLAAARVNIDELETGVSSAPMTGETLFRATARVHVPEDVALDALREQLESLAGELMVDLTLDEAG